MRQWLKIYEASTAEESLHILICSTTILCTRRALEDISQPWRSSQVIYTCTCRSEMTPCEFDFPRPVGTGSRPRIFRSPSHARVFSVHRSLANVRTSLRYRQEEFLSEAYLAQRISIRNSSCSCCDVVQSYSASLRLALCTVPWGWCYYSVVTARHIQTHHTYRKASVMDCLDYTWFAGGQVNTVT